MNMRGLVDDNGTTQSKIIFASGEVYSQEIDRIRVCRNRLAQEETILVGGREDRLTRRGEELRILRRKLVVPQRVVKDTNLYYFI